MKGINPEENAIIIYENGKNNIEIMVVYEQLVNQTIVVVNEDANLSDWYHCPHEITPCFINYGKI